MIAIIVCFNLAVSLEDQIKQITYWLDFLNSSLAPPPLSTSPKWVIILVGVRADEQTDFSLTQTSDMIATWQKKWPKLPLAHKIFSVSSLKSKKSVKTLLEFVEGECARILKHAHHIPSSFYKTFLLELKKTDALVHWTELFQYFAPKLNVNETSFKSMLQYFQAIGRIVQLPNGMIFTDPTIAPKIAAKFVSPKRVRLLLLKQETEKVQILDDTEVGCLLDIDTSDNKRFLFSEILKKKTLLTY